MSGHMKEGDSNGVENPFQKKKGKWKGKVEGYFRLLTIKVTKSSYFYHP